MIDTYVPYIGILSNSHDLKLISTHNLLNCVIKINEYYFLIINHYFLTYQVFKSILKI